jgi:hypothetical protein
MAYAIMRTEKLKSTGSISACEKHNMRTRETLNTDETLRGSERMIPSNL